MRKTFVLQLVVLATLSTTLVSYAADWPNWRGPDHDGISKETGFNPAALSELKIAWKAQVGTGYSSITVADGRAYTMGNINKDTDVVFCFDALTGKEIWQHKYPEELNPKYYEGGTTSTPTIEGGKVYTISKTGKVFCLDAAAGTVLWQKKLNFKEPIWGFAGSAFILDEKCIFNVGASGVALDKNTGEFIWQSEDAQSGYSTPVPFEHNDTTCLAIFGHESIMAVEAATGKLLWSYPWKTKPEVNAADPIVVDKQVFIASGYGHGSALIDFSGEQPVLVYENKNMESQMSGPVLIDGFLYGIDDKQLACVEWKTGEQKWAEKSIGKGSLSAVGDKLLIMSEKGQLLVAQASPEGYKELASAKVFENKGWTVPVYANGRIYVRDMVKSDPGTLVCIDMNR